MITWSLGDDNDILLNGDEIAVVTDGDETAQAIQTRLRTFEGESFINQNYGIPYFQALNNANNVEAMNLTIKRVIESTEGVTSVNLQSKLIEDAYPTYSITATVDTEYSEDPITINQNYEV